MNGNDADRQIKQMVSFILQEAEEKANEIRIKTEHDFNLEKQMLVHHAKLKIQEEYARKEKEREVNFRIARSAEIGASRKQKMIAREDLLQGLLAKAKKECQNIVKDSAKYQQLLKQLIVQGLIKVFEEEVVVQCRPTDVPLVNAVLASAKQEYVDIMKKEANLDVNINLSIAPEKRLLPATCSGGVYLLAHEGKISCDNTLDIRLDQINYEQMPVIRKMLFPSN